MAIEDHPDVQVFDEIEQIEYMVRNAVTRILPVGLTYAQYEVLNLLCRRGDGITPGEIARSLMLTKSSLTNTLQRLAARQLAQVVDRSDVFHGNARTVCQVDENRGSTAVRAAKRQVPGVFPVV